MLLFLRKKIKNGKCLPLSFFLLRNKIIQIKRHILHHRGPPRRVRAQTPPHQMKHPPHPSVILSNRRAICHPTSSAKRKGCQTTSHIHCLPKRKGPRHGCPTNPNQSEFESPERVIHKSHSKTFPPRSPQRVIHKSHSNSFPLRGIQETRSPPRMIRGSPQSSSTSSPPRAEFYNRLTPPAGCRSPRLDVHKRPPRTVFYNRSTPPAGCRPPPPPVCLFLGRTGYGALFCLYRSLFLAHRASRCFW